MTARATIYLDYAAATPCSKFVVDAMLPYLSDNFYNPSSPYAPAVMVRRELENARHNIAKSIGVKHTDVIFTAGATESINLAFTSAHGGHVVTSAIEHHAVLESAKHVEHSIIQPDARGTVSAEDVAAAIREDTKLVSIALANNEIGTIQPLAKIAQVVIAERQRRRNNGVTTPIWLHTDASQGVGQIDISPGRLGVDMMTINAAKCYGPKQMGLLWRDPKIDLRPLIYGGGQEGALRSGTENVAGIMGFEAALTIAEARRKSESARLAEMRSEMQRLIEDALPDVIVSGHPKRRLPGHLHVAFEGLDAERLIFMLEADGVYVATGSACAANSGTRSHVLEAIGMTPAQADGSLRISLGLHTTQEDMRAASEIIINAVKLEKQRIGK